MHKKTLSILIVSLMFAACSKEASDQRTANINTSNTSPSQDSNINAPAKTIIDEQALILGNRILNSAFKGEDGKIYPPLLKDFKQYFPECNFTEIGYTYLQSECKFNNVSADKSAEVEPFKVYLTNPRAGIIAITFDQLNLHYNAQFSFFDNLNNVVKAPLSCPDIEIENSASFYTNFYRVSKNGVDYGTVREVVSSGSGGGATQTTIYFGLNQPPCAWSETNDKNLSLAIAEMNRKNNLDVSSSLISKNSNQPSKKSLTNFEQNIAYNYSINNAKCNEREASSAILASKCVDLETAEFLCKNTSGFTVFARQTSSVWMSQDRSRFVGSGGDFSQGPIQWNNGRCYGTFYVSGVLNGTSTRITVHGTVSSFVVTGDGRVLVYYLHTL